MNGNGKHFLALCIKQYILHSVEQIHCIYNALNNTIHTVEQIQDLGQAGNELSDLSRSIGVRLSKLVSHSKIVKGLHSDSRVLTLDVYRSCFDPTDPKGKR